MMDTRAGMEGLLNQRLGVAAQKQEILDKATRKKEAQFNPLNIDNIEHVDGDTYRLKDQDQLIRMGGGVDTFESQEWAYENNPEREAAHKRAMSKLTGTPEWMISRSDLLERGKVQADETKRRISELGTAGNLGYKQTGVDAHGRQIGELQDLDTGANPFADYSGREQNAAYQSKFNAEQRVRDLFSGERGEHERFTGSRSFRDMITDQPINLLHGAGRMLNEIAQAGSVLAKAGSAPTASTDARFERNRDRLERFRERFLSPQQLGQERLRQKNQSRARQVYDVNYRQYIDEGDTPSRAKLKAGAAEFGDTIKSLIANPGHILDATIESLPYMIGVGAVGRVVATKGAQALSKKVATEVLAAGGTGKQAALSAAKYGVSKEGRAAISKLSVSSGVATVGLTEGLSNSAEVYSSIANMTEEEALQSQAYLDLREEGMEHGEAVRQLGADAFHSTFLKSVALAAAASLATGAGSWESKLFTTKADKLKLKLKPKIKTKPKAPAKTLKGKAARGVQGIAKFAGPAGLRESAEELLQSGGGEFLSQLASFEATGEEVGPGIGAAAAEGAVIGFASGAGMQTVFGGLKALGTADAKTILKAGSKFKEGRQAKVVSPTVETKAASVAPEVETVIDNPSPTIDYNETFETILGKVADNPTEEAVVHNYVALRDLAQAAADNGTPISDTHAANLQILGDFAKDDMRVTVEAIQQKDPKDYSGQDLALLTLAADIGVEVDTSKLSTEQKAVIDSTVKLAVSFDALETNREEQVANAPKQESTIRRVWREKFGTGMSKVGNKMRPGLGWYRRTITDAMTSQSFTTKDNELNETFENLKTFIGSQSAYFENAKAALESKSKVGNVAFVEEDAEKGVGGTRALVEILEREDKEMKAIVQELAGRWEAWKAAGQGQATPQAVETAPEAAPESAPAPETAEESPSQPKVSKPLRSQLTKLRTQLGNPQLGKKLASFIRNAKRSGDEKVLADAIALNTENLKIIADKKKAAPKDNTAQQYQLARFKELDAMTSNSIQKIAIDLGIDVGDNPDIAALIQQVIATEIKAGEDTKFAEDSVHGTPISGVQDESAPATQPTAAAVAEGPQTLRQAVNEGFVAALDFIIARTKTPAVPALAARLKEQLAGRDIKIVNLNQEEMTAKFDNEHARAAWSQSKNTIYLNITKLNTGAKYQNSLLHEMVHASIDGWLDGHPGSDLANELAALNREVILALLAENTPSAHAMSQLLSRSKEELLTYGLTSPYMQNFLQNMKIKDTTAWSKFVQIITSMLGIEDTTALHRVLSLTERVFNEVNPPSVPAEAEADAQAQPEQEAEGDPAVQENLARIDRAIRLSETRRMQTLIESGAIEQSDIFLTNSEDLAFLNNLLENNVPMVQAVAQLQSVIEPNPEERNVKVETTVDQETIDKVSNNAAILNARDNKTEIEARGMPERWIDFRNYAAGQLARVAKAFDKFKLPLRLADAFSTRNSKVKDLLASDDFVMAVLTDTGAREQFFDKIGATPAEQKALAAFSQFYEAFYNKLAANLRKIDPISGLGHEGLAGLDQNLLPYFMDDNGNLDANVVAAMALESMQYLTSRGTQTTFNSEVDIRSMLGLPEGTRITKEMWTSVGRGVLRNHITSEIGYSAVAHVNIKANDTTKPLLYDTLALAMGAQSVAVLADLKVERGGEMVPLVKTHWVNRKLWNEMSEDETTEDSGTGPIVLFRNNTTETVFDYTTMTFPRVDVNAPLREAIEEGKGIFSKLFASNANVRSPVFEIPETGDVPTKVARSMSKIPRKMRARMLIDMQKHYEVDMEMLELLERFNPQTFLEMAHDLVPTFELERKHKTERPGLQARNDGLIRDLQEAVAWGTKYGAKNFYLPLKMIRSGRVYIDSNVINPQASKIHRFLFVREGWKRNIKKEESGEMYERFMAAVGLGLGIKVEELTAEQIVKDVKAFFQAGDGKTVLDALAKGKEEDFTITEMDAFARVLKEEGTHTLAALNAYMKWNNAKSGVSVSVSLPMESDGTTNGYIAGLLQTPPPVITASYKRLLNAGGIFFKGDPWQNWAEYKAAGGLDNYQYIAAGVRNFLQGNKSRADQFQIVKSMKNTDKRGVLMLRKTDRVWASGIVPNIAELETGNAVGRKWAKDPLLVSSYGAGIASVVKAMVKVATEKFYENLATAQNGTVEEIATAINSAYGLANTWVDASNEAQISRLEIIDGKKHWVSYERVGTQSPDGYYTAAEVQAGADQFYGGDLSLMAREFVLPGTVQNYMGQALASTYGRALEQSLADRLRDVLEIRRTMNASNKLSNLLYEADFTRRVNTLENDKGNKVSPADRQKIREEMMREGLVPVIQTPASESLEDALETTKYTRTVYMSGGQPQGGRALLQDPRQITEIEYGTDGQTRIPPAARSLGAHITAPTPTSNVGVAAVVSGIHGTDGVNNSAAWGQEDYAVGNVHDAQLSPWWAANDVAGLTNADFGQMHSGYNMPDQFLRTLIRMHASLMHDNDTRLDQVQKDNIAKAMLAINQGKHNPVRIDWNLVGIDPVANPVEAGNYVISRLITTMQNQTVDSIAGKVSLFADIRAVDQFATTGSAAVFPDGIEVDGANDSWHLQEKMQEKDLTSMMRDYLTQGLPIHEKAIEWFKDTLADDNADAGVAFRSYVEHQSTDAASALDMLANSMPGQLGAQLQILNNVLNPYIAGIRISIDPEAVNPIADFMNNVVQAAAVPMLTEMQERNPEEFAALQKTAFARGRQLMKRGKAENKPGLVTVGREIVRHEQMDRPVLGIAVFLGRTLSAPTTTDPSSYSLFFAKDFKSFTGYLSNLQQALRAGKGTSTVLFDELNQDEDLSNRYEDMLESEKVVKIFDDLALLEQTAEDPTHQAHLREVVSTLVVPGLESIEPILQQVVVDNTVTTNLGETVQIPEYEGDVIRLRAAGNALTNNADSSLQEKAANEYVHNIVDHAHSGNHFIRKEVRRLFESAKKQLTWRAFLPETVTGDPQIAEDRARERYDWIFNNPDANKGYVSFISIGTTNQAFGQALSNIDNPSVSFAVPQVSQGFLRAMMSVVRQAVQFLAGTSQRFEGGTLKDATRALAQATIAVNQRNQQRVKEAAEGPQGNKINRLNSALVNAVNNRIVDPLGAGLSAINQKRLDPDNPTVPGFLKAATFVALKTRDSEVRKEYNKFYRQVAGEQGIGKDNSFFQILAEITPWDSNNYNWVDILRKSKYMVDMARQDATEHTRSFIMDSFDKNNHMTQEHKQAMTKTLLKTDLSSLMDGEAGIKLGDLVDLLADKNMIFTEISRLETILRSRLSNANVADRFGFFQTQYIGLGESMRTGRIPIGNQMLNAHNIVNQFMLPDVSKKAVTDPEVLKLVDSLATLHSMKGLNDNDLRLTQEIIRHEMDRTDVDENGFSRLMGMQIDFKALSQANLFNGNPIQMRKGYVYELYDGDINIKAVQKGSPEQELAEAEGMLFVGTLQKDVLDKGPVRYLYKGNRGLATYNKAAVSLTDLHHSGANLFSVEGYRSQAALQKLGTMRSANFNEVLRQGKPGYSRAGDNAVPILNDQGQIVDYRYMMTENTKEKVLKKQDPFDRVLPHMFGSLKDRPATVAINRKIVDLAYDEWSKLKDNTAEFRFVEIGRAGPGKEAQEMWRLMPEDMRRYAATKFPGDRIFLRDDVVNLVLGYRKMSALNIKDPTGTNPTIWGKGTPVARIADKVWLEAVTLMRIKIAVLTPLVVIGNIASNTAMLLGEGISPAYIRKNASEAISSMRQYQKDRKKATELEREIGAAGALGKDTTQKALQLGRLNADLQANPVGKLVEEGLFTSIASDLGVNDDTIRGSMIQKLEDKATGRLSKGAMKLAKEAYMLPGSKGYKAAVAATQYGDFVARYIKVKYNTTKRGVDPDTAIRDALASFIYYDIPQNKYLQAANDYGPMMFTKFFFRIQHVVAKLYSENPISATSVLMLQRALPQPFDENIMNYGLGEGGLSKITLNVPGKMAEVLDPTEPAAWQWLTNPLGL